MIHRKGFSLIETIVAATLVLTVFTSSYALINYTLVNINYIQNGLTALFLAQEGVELTIAQRDANWIANRSFFAGQQPCRECSVAFQRDRRLSVRRRQ